MADTPFITHADARGLVAEIKAALNERLALTELHQRERFDAIDRRLDRGSDELKAHGITLAEHGVRLTALEERPRPSVNDAGLVVSKRMMALFTGLAAGLFELGKMVLSYLLTQHPK